MKKFKIFLTLTMAALFAVIGGGVSAAIIGCSPVIPSVAIFAANWIPTPSGLMCIKLFTAPGGAGVPFSQQLTFIPEFLIFDNTVPLTSLKFETAEDGVLDDWDSAALIAMANFMVKGVPVAGTLTFRLSDGKIYNKTATISGITSAAGAVDFFGSSDRVGRLPLQSTRGKALAGVPLTLTKFTALFIPTMAPGDTAQVTYSNGLQETFAPEELAQLSANFQNVTGIIVNNYTSYISQVIITCAADTPVYILRAKIAGQSM